MTRTVTIYYLLRYQCLWTKIWGTYILNGQNYEPAYLPRYRSRLRAKKKNSFSKRCQLSLKLTSWTHILGIPAISTRWFYSKKTKLFGCNGRDVEMVKKSHVTFLTCSLCGREWLFETLIPINLIPTLTLLITKAVKLKAYADASEALTLNLIIMRN